MYVSNLKRSWLKNSEITQQPLIMNSKLIINHKEINFGRLSRLQIPNDTPGIAYCSSIWQLAFLTSDLSAIFGILPLQVWEYKHCETRISIIIVICIMVIL
jgi:hypothetical protein